MKDKPSPRMFRRMAKSPVGILELLMSDIAAVTHLALAGQLSNSADGIKEAVHIVKEHLTEDGKDENDLPPEHRELVEALSTAVESAEVALDAAINAAWQAFWMDTKCECRDCLHRRQMENAEMS